MEHILEDSIVDEINKKLQTTGELDEKDAVTLLAYCFQQRRKHQSNKHPSDYERTDEQGRPLTYWGGLKDEPPQNRECVHPSTDLSGICPQCGKQVR